MHNKLLILFIFLFGYSLNVQGKDDLVINLNDNFKSITSKGNFQYTIGGNVANYPTNEVIDKNHFSLGVINKPISINGTITNSSNNTISTVLEIYNPTLDAGVFSIYRNEALVSETEFGDNYKFKDRSFMHRNFIFPIAIEPGDTLDLEIFIHPQLEAIFVPFRLVEASVFFKNGTRNYLVVGGILGLYFVYVLFIICMFLLVKRSLFIYYATVNIFVFLYCIFDLGLGMQFLWCNLPIFQDIVVAVAGFGYILGLISFGRAFFSTRIKYPKLDKILIVFIIFAIIAFISIIVLYFFFEAPILIPLLALNIVYILFGLTICVLGLVTYLQAGRREGFWFLVLFFVQLIMWLLLLNQRGYFGQFVISPDAIIYSFFSIKSGTPHYLFLNMVLEVVIVSSIIAFRFQNNLEEYNISQKKIEFINESSINAFIKGQEVERSFLAGTLEQKIGKDLKIIKSEIFKSKEFVKNKEDIESTIDQLQDVQKDLDRIASDFVINWKSIILERIVDKVTEQLNMGMIDLEVFKEFDDELNKIDWNDLTKLNIYRILQEICNNVIKHSKANQLKITFRKEKGSLVIFVKDNGVGFNIDEVKLRNGIGLRNIETRVKALKGKISVEGGALKGTKVEILVPIKLNILNET